MVRTNTSLLPIWFVVGEGTVQRCVWGPKVSCRDIFALVSCWQSARGCAIHLSYRYFVPMGLVGLACRITNKTINLQPRRGEILVALNLILNHRADCNWFKKRYLSRLETCSIKLFQQINRGAISGNTNNGGRKKRKYGQFSIGLILNDSFAYHENKNHIVFRQTSQSLLTEEVNAASFSTANKRMLNQFLEGTFTLPHFYCFYFSVS